MKNIYKLIIAFLFACILLVTASCKKYPDGPLLSIYSKAGRVEGNWDVEYFSINGYDSTAYLKNKPFYGHYYFSTKKDGLNMIAIYSGSFYKNGYWEFKNKKNDLFIHFDEPTGQVTPTVGPYRANDILWEIRRLKVGELWLKTFYQGREFYVKFKHISI